MATEYWLIEWQDISGERDRDIKEIAVSPAEAADAVRRILEGEIVIDCDQIAADGTCPPEASGMHLPVCSRMTTQCRSSRILMNRWSRSATRGPSRSRGCGRDGCVIRIM
jgi:hypothetical protein